MANGYRHATLTCMPVEECLAATASWSERGYRLAMQIAEAREAEVRRMLGLWVSELEPVILYQLVDGPGFGVTGERLIGLGIKDDQVLGALVRVVIHAKEGTP
jgi:hypothetical protein